MPLPILVTVLAFITLCIILDIRTRRIPNQLSGPAMLAGVLLNGLYFGGPGVLTSLTGFAVTLLALLWAFALGGIGGGDVKMMAAVGALVGPRLALSSLALGVLLGGAIMIVHLARKGRLHEKLASIRTMITASVLTRSASPLKVSAADPGAISLPYSVPLGLGTIGMLALQGYGRCAW
jgi:prepilin peptidase CpaA